MVFIGLFETSFAEYKVVLELDPLSIWYNQSMGWGYYHARRYDESIAQFKKTLALIEDFPDPVKEWQVHTQLAWNYIKKGLYDEALAEIDAWNPDSFARAWAYVEAGRRDEAAELINKLLGEPEVLPYVAAVLGEKDLAFRRLEAMYEERNTYMLFLKVGVELDNLRSDPRYADLLRRMDFPD